MARVLVVVEVSPTDAGAFRPASLSAVALARRLLELKGGSFDLLLLGAGPAVAHGLTQQGAEQVITADLPPETTPTERWAACVAALAGGFDLVVATATSFGKDLMPRVAAHLDAGYVADCTGLCLEDGELCFRRPLYAGNVEGHCRVTTPQVVVTARQSEWRPLAPVSAVSPLTVATPPSATGSASRIERLGFEAAASDRPDLGEARVVVAGGRGLGEQFLPLLGPLAEALGAAIGASRAACDAGVVPGDLQIGQTGRIVAPDLYIAAGISGAVQHTAGIRGARCVVAINRDPEAPIFEIADYGLVADLFQALPELTRALSGRRPGT